MVTLAVSKRDTQTASRTLRSKGSIPAVVYGPKQEATAISVSLKEFERVFQNAGESSVVELSGLGDSLQVLIHDVDHDPITSVPRHADFYAIEKGAKVEVAVPIVFVGESLAVRSGASLVKVLHELDIKADAAHLPHNVTIDVSVLGAIGDRLRARDIALPEGVLLMIDPDEVVALVQEVVVEEEAPVVAEVDMAAIEVEKKGKEETVEGEGVPAPEKKEEKKEKK